jgi:hypothetical protein
MMNEINVQVQLCLIRCQTLNMNYYGFQQIIKLPTHRRGGLLDHFYTNIGSESTGITFNTIPTYYSDHMLLSFA